MKKALILALLFAFSCKSDDPTPSVDVLSTFLKEKADLQINTRVNDITWELGTVISSSKTGTVTHLGTNMPSAGKYYVSLWDHDTKSQLAAVQIDQGLELTMRSITPVKIEAGKKYVLSILARNLNTGNRTGYKVITSNEGSSARILPFTHDFLTYHEACYTQNSISQPLFPGVVTGVLNEMYGLPDFRFQAD